MLEGKVIAITGAGSGMGQATAVLCAEAGAALVLGDVNGTGLEETKRRIEAKGGSAVCTIVDVTSEDQVAAFVNLAKERFGRLDGAFNNAGRQMHNKLLPDLSLEEFNSINAINSTGVFLCMKHEIPLMRETGGGVIVNTASCNGVIAYPGSAEYTASKHAVIGLTRAASTEAVSTGVRANCVLPGMIQTPMVADLVKSDMFKPFYDAALERHSIGRFGVPEDVGYVVRFLLSDQSAFVNGAAIPVDGGYLAR